MLTKVPQNRLTGSTDARPRSVWKLAGVTLEEIQVAQGASTVRPQYERINSNERIPATRRLMAEATQSILVSTHAFAWLDRVQEVLQERRGKVPVEVFMTNPSSPFFFTPDEAETAKQSANRLKAIGVKVKFIDWHPDFRGTIVDNREAIIIDADCTYLASSPTFAIVSKLLNSLADMSPVSMEDYRIVTMQRLKLEQVVFVDGYTKSPDVMKTPKMSGMKAIWKWALLAPLSFVVGIAIVALATVEGLGPLLAIAVLLACVLMLLVSSFVGGRH